MPDGGALNWREVVDQYHSRLIDELSAHLDSERRGLAAQAELAERAHTTRNLECLNQVLRRLRSAGEQQVLQLLAEGCAPYASRLVVLVFETNQAGKSLTRAAASAGLPKETVTFETTLAPAVVAVIESRDRVTALATPGELSPVLAEAFGSGSDNPKAYLFPVSARHSVMAVLVASEASASAQIELLCEAAGMRLEAASASVAAEKTTGDVSWETLSGEDKKLHVQAQRVARVRVAEMRLAHASDLKNGTAAADIYTALRQPIDAARQQFRETFLAKSPTMVDYLHMEILRSFAHDDERLMGANYPGPMQAATAAAAPAETSHV